MKKLMALIAAMVFVAGTAYAAADWNFYGSARVNTEYVDTEVPGAADTEDTDLFLQGNSRIGANVKVSDELTGRFEVGLSEKSTVNTRIIWGEWNFGGGSFGVGQHYSPLNLFYSNQIFGGDTNLLPYGGVYSGREPMLQLTFGSFEIALVDEGVEGDGVANIETNMPGIEAKYGFSMDAFTAIVCAGYNTYELTSGGVTYDVDSYVIALGLEANLGMVYVKGDVYFGENADKLIWTDYTSGVEPGAAVVGGQLLDVENFGFLVLAGAKLNDMFAVEAGYGYADADVDQSTTDQEVTSYYLQATITLAPGVFIVPEIGAVDYEENTENEITYGAIKWQINF